MFSHFCASISKLPAILNANPRCIFPPNYAHYNVSHSFNCTINILENSRTKHTLLVNSLIANGFQIYRTNDGIEGKLRRYRQKSRIRSYEASYIMSMKYIFPVVIRHHIQFIIYMSFISFYTHLCKPMLLYSLKRKNSEENKTIIQMADGNFIVVIIIICITRENDLPFYSLFDYNEGC